MASPIMRRETGLRAKSDKGCGPSRFGTAGLLPVTFTIQNSVSAVSIGHSHLLRKPGPLARSAAPLVDADLPRPPNSHEMHFSFLFFTNSESSDQFCKT